MRDWALEHPWMTFWIFIVLLCVTGDAIKFTFRTINIAAHGWPPEHLDADGDFKSEESGQ